MNIEQIKSKLEEYVHAYSDRPLCCFLSGPSNDKFTCVPVGTYKPKNWPWLAVQGQVTDKAIQDYLDQDQAFHKGEWKPR